MEDWMVGPRAPEDTGVEPSQDRGRGGAISMRDRDVIADRLPDGVGEAFRRQH